MKKLVLQLEGSQQGIEKLYELYQLKQLSQLLNCSVIEAELEIDQSSSTTKIDRSCIQLTDWLQNVFDENWLALQELLSEPQLAANFRLGSSSSTPLGVSRGKRLNLEVEGKETAVTLLVGLMPAPKSELDVWVGVYPSDRQQHLPSNLELSVLGEDGSVQMHALAGNHNEGIRLQFSCESGELFRIRVAMGTMSLTQAFVA